MSARRIAIGVVSRVGKQREARVDGVSVRQVLENDPFILLEEIRKELLAKTYRPSPVLRVHIPKGDGKTRPLGIPTVKDRIVQQAAVLILQPIFEEDFLDCSFGYRPKRSAHQALERIEDNLKAGREEVYDADLKSFFDTIPHEKLMIGLQQRLADRSVLRLIRLWLKAPIVERDKAGRKTGSRPERGTPQEGRTFTPLGELVSSLVRPGVSRQGRPGPVCKSEADPVRRRLRYHGEVHGPTDHRLGGIRHRRTIGSNDQSRENERRSTARAGRVA